MRSYVITTGLVFLAVVLVHVARVAFEGMHVLHDPAFIVTTVLAIALVAWAWRLLRQR
jgi:cell shape-determining protein MreD